MQRFELHTRSARERRVYGNPVADARAACVSLRPLKPNNAKPFRAEVCVTSQLLDHIVTFSSVVACRMDVRGDGELSENIADAIRLD